MTISRWYRLKEKSIQIRKKGVSIRNIEKQLGIPRSTLSGWFKNIKLSQLQKQKLADNHSKALNKARKIAIKWHHQQKEIRLNKAKNEALNVLSCLNIKDKNLIELALSMLYLGEGTKEGSTILGNSNAQILNFYIACLTKLYNINRSNLKCYLHLRSDQNSKTLMNYWSNILSIPIENFNTSIDKRTVKSDTYPNYKGVCVISCGNIAIQRRMLYLSNEFCKRISVMVG